VATGGFVFDRGNYQHTLDTALGMVGDDQLRRQQAELRGRYRGIGLATDTEFTGLGPGRANAAVGFSFGGWEHARVLVHPTGRVSVHVGAADHGQGHQTSYAQLAADALGLRPDDIDIVEGDTARVEFGCGTFNSRSLPVGAAPSTNPAGGSWPRPAAAPPTPWPRPPSTCSLRLGCSAPPTPPAAAPATG
jgi:carbon-monoxide dehydrogenase large subunit